MHIDKYKVEGSDWPYVLAGTHYPDAQAVLGSFINSCGCGNPDASIRYVADILTIIDKGTSSDLNEGSWGESRKELKAFFKSEGEYYFVLYNLDTIGFTEHGSSVGGSWITNEGKEFLEDALEYFKQQTEDNA